MGVLVVGLLFATSVSADKLPEKKKPPAAKPAPAPAAVEPAGSAAPADEGPQLPPHVEGPKLVDLGNSSEIDLPAGMFMFEHAVAKKIMEDEGGSGEAVVGAVFKPGEDWGVVLEYDPIGYIDDSDAGELDADELLKSYKEGTIEQNAKKRSLGKPELFVDGWSEKPRYEKATHHLVWGLKLHDSNGEQIINFFTRILGRNGYMSVNLIAAPDKMEAAKVQALSVLTNTRFKTGALYTDHKSGDKDSGIGLKALVLGGAGIAVVKAAKAGIIIKLLLVFKKAFIFIAAGIAGFFKWLFGRKKNANLDVASGPPPTTPSDQG